MQSVRLNLVPSGTTPIIYLKQNDTTPRTFSISVYDGADEVDLTAYTVTLQGTKPSGLGFSGKSGVVSEDAANIITFNADEDFTSEAGNIPAELYLVSGGAIRSASLKFVVSKAAHDDGTLDGNTEQVVSDMKNYYDKAASAAAAAVATAALMAAMVAVTVSIAAAAAAAVLLGAAVLIIATGSVQAAAGLRAIASALPVVAKASDQSLSSLNALSVGLVAYAVSAQTAGSSSGTMASESANVAIVLAAMATALKAASTGLSNLSKDAKTAEKSLNNMDKSIAVFEKSLKSMESTTKNSTNSVKKAFESTSETVQKAGLKAGTGFTSYLRAGLATAPSVALSVIQSIIAVFISGYGGVYSAGVYIGMGLANGMAAALGTVRAVAAQLAAAADQAIRAKAQINSPSKVATEAGEYYGEGWVNGILSKVRDAWNAAEKLVSFPAVSVPDVVVAYGGSLSAEYDYYRNAEYTIEVPLAVDGKEFARATASYTQDELNRQQTHTNRKYGRA